METVTLYVLMSCLSVGLVYGADCNTIVKGDPLTIEKSVGKWSLAAVAHKIVETIDADIGTDRALIDVRVEDGVPHMTHMIIAGTPTRTVNRDIKVKDGYLTYTYASFGGKPIFRYVTDNCALFSFNSSIDAHFLYCRHMPSSQDIKKFADYATCDNYHNFVIRRDSEPSCLDIPHKRRDFHDLEKMNGKWKMVAAAAPACDCEIATEMKISVDWYRVNISLAEGPNVMTIQRFQDELQFKSADGTVYMIDLYESPEDSLLVLVGMGLNQPATLSLISRTGHVDDKEIVKFRHFASCLSSKVIYVNE